MLETSACTTGPLNQYTAIGRGEEAAFEPVHDADGNQTLIRTSTGIWQVAYNAENRPVRFVNESGKRRRNFYFAEAGGKRHDDRNCKIRLEIGKRAGKGVQDR